MSEEKKNNQGPKGSDVFKEVLKNYLDNKAQNDPLFKERYMNPEKSLDDCITYIFNTVKKSGICGFEDDEVFSMATHYYDEQEIEIGEIVVNGQVIVNRSIQLSEQEIEDAKDKARERIFEQERKRMTTKKKPKEKKAPLAPLPDHIRKMYPEQEEEQKQREIDLKKFNEEKEFNENAQQTLF